MDHAIRLMAFSWLEEQTAVYQGLLPRTLLETGFGYQGSRVTLVGPKGIWKPKNMTLPISITTVLDGPYDDSKPGEGLLLYKYRGTDPQHPDNAQLRQMMHNNIPLVYFYAVAKGKYHAFWPAFITGDDISSLTFQVAIDDVQSAIENTPDVVADADVHATYGRRAYLTTMVAQRLHQAYFRYAVMTAYKEQCTLCRLKHPELLDAAHIIPDKQEGGEPVVQNGLALCKIHHAAFDKNIIGITPDYEVTVRTDILKEIDGPMLKHGLQEMNKQQIILPSDIKSWPDKDRLQVRYQKFLRAG